MRFIIPPMTPEDAVTAVLNVCMHTMANKLPWDDARNLLMQLMQDAFDMGAAKAKEEVPISTTNGEHVDKLA